VHQEAHDETIEPSGPFQRRRMAAARHRQEQTIRQLASCASKLLRVSHAILPPGDDKNWLRDFREATAPRIFPGASKGAQQTSPLTRMTELSLVVPQQILIEAFWMEENGVHPREEGPRLRHAGRVSQARADLP
jgi:hypothetical protein